jgi:RNA recognition motif-containing protein
MNLFVAGLPFDVDDQELKEFFEAYGKVASAKVILDKETRKSRGFGFVEMPDVNEAKQAIQGLDGAELENKTLAVKEAEERRPAGNNRTGGGGFRQGNNNRGGYSR